MCSMCSMCIIIVTKLLLLVSLVLELWFVVIIVIVIVILANTITNLIILLLLLLLFFIISSIINRHLRLIKYEFDKVQRPKSSKQIIKLEIESINKAEVAILLLISSIIIYLYFGLDAPPSARSAQHCSMV